MKLNIVLLLILVGLVAYFVMRQKSISQDDMGPTEVAAETSDEGTDEPFHSTVDEEGSQDIDPVAPVSPSQDEPAEILDSRSEDAQPVNTADEGHQE